MNYLNKTKFQLLIICLLTILVYSNIFQNDFVNDDGDFVFNWQTTKHLESLPKLFTTESAPNGHEGVYRPIKGLFLALSYALWGFNKVGYHLVSLAVALASVVLVYFIVKELQIRLESLPFLTALLFGLHPIHTEAITFITAAYDSLGVCLALASLLFYLKLSNLKQFNLKIYAWSLFCGLMAFFTYELTLVLPLLLISFDLCFRQKEIQKNFARFLKIYSAYFLLLIFYFGIRLQVHLPARGEYLGNNFFQTQLVMVLAFSKYIKLVLLPLNLSIDHKIADGIFSVIYASFVNLKTLNSLSIFTPQVLFGLIVILSLIGLILKNFRKMPLISFCLSWFMISLVPVLYIFPQGMIMAERYLFLASFGFCLLLAWIILWLYQKAQTGLVKSNLVILILVILVCYSYQTFFRNFDWKDTQTSWTVLASQIPDDPVTQYTTAKIYMEKGQTQRAIDYFNQALKIEPNIPEVHYRLGNIYKSDGRIKEASGEYQLAVSDNVKYKALALRAIRKLDFLSKNPKFNYEENRKIWHSYESKNGIEFDLTQGWLVQDSGSDLELIDLNSDFSIEMLMTDLPKNVSPEDYFNSTFDQFGYLEVEGLAQLPNFSNSFVRRYKGSDSESLEFFLFKDSKVLRVHVYPLDSNCMADFNKFLGSIKIGSPQTL